MCAQPFPKGDAIRLLLCLTFHRMLQKSTCINLFLQKYKSCKHNQTQGKINPTVTIKFTVSAIIEL